uniref:Uncharacterized protein n=1 Tax=Alexandrium andersonii TaxID=327968 RepID=A0A7S2HQB6_9DINO
MLREPPAQLRQRLRLPGQPPRPKRARVGSAVGGQGRDGPALRSEELAEAFRQATGSEATTEEVLALVADSAYVDELEGTVHALDARTLPQDPMERLKRLFELQTHWQPERLAAFLAPTLGAGLKVDPWLMKFTRVVHVEVEQGKEQRMLIKKFAGI